MISCEQFEDLRDQGAEAECEAHLAACPACVKRLKSWLVVAEALRGLGSAEAAFDATDGSAGSKPLEDRLVQAILGARRAGQARGGEARVG